MEKTNVEPYVGPRPFQRIDKAFFFGREKEASDLLSLIIANPLLLLYSRSGAGKTSLINARLVPMLEREGIYTLPIARVQGRIPKEINLGETLGANVYVFNVLASWKKKEDDPLVLMKMSLAEFLSRERKPVGEGEQEAPRVIVFDQFEELFTFYPGRWADRLEFFRQVGDLLEGSPLLLRASDLQSPADLVADFAKGRSALSGSLVKRLSPKAQELIRNSNGVAGTLDAIKLLVDDLNQIIQGDSLYDERALAGAELRSETIELIQRQPVGREIHRLNRLLIEDAYPLAIRRRTEGDPLLRVVFSMREDYIAELDPYASVLPNKLRSRYRLEPLRARAALSAVTGPLEKTNLKFAPGVAEHLVENLLKIQMKTAEGITEIPGEFVEPVQLQVVCQSLWENVRGAGEKVITEEHLTKHGNVGRALRAFYEKTIQKVMQTKEIKEGVLRRWFEEVLITTAGTRGMVFRGRTTTGELDNDVVDELESQHIIQAELRGGERWYELSHDRFIQPIRESNNEWRLARSGAVSKRDELEAKAKDWVSGGRGDVGLLDESAAVEAKRWMDSAEAKEIVYSEDLFAFVTSSRLAVSKAKAEEIARSSRHLRWLTAALGLIVIFAIGMTAYAFTQKAQAEAETKRANEETERANTQTTLARSKEIIAQQAKEESEKAREAAQSSAEEAKAASQEADKQRRIAEEKAKYLAEAQEDLREEARKANEARENAVEFANIAEVERKKAEKARKEAEDRLKELTEAKTVDALKEEAAQLERSGNYSEAISAYQRALTIYEKSNDAAGQASTLEKIGRIYASTTDVESSVGSFNKALSLLAQDDQTGKARILRDLGDAQARYDYSKALKYFQEALKIARDTSDRQGEFLSLSGIARSEVFGGHYPEAEKTFKAALMIAEEQKDQQAIADTYLNLGHTNVYQQKESGTVEYYLKALGIVETMNDISKQEEVLRSLIYIYNAMGNKAEVLKYTRKLEALRSNRKL